MSTSLDRRSLLTITAAALLPKLAAAQTGPAGEKTTAHLRSETQALLDAVSSGDAAVWERVLHADAVATTEAGEVFDRKRLVSEIKPFPANVSGELNLLDFSARIHGPVAVVTYVIDEHERYHGAALHCQYRNTDTWTQTPAGWRLLAMQTLALRTDPPAVSLAGPLLEEYCGRYSLAPDLAYEIRRKAAGPGAAAVLEAVRKDRPARELFAEAPGVLFTPGQPRYRWVFQRDAAGKVTGFAERREAWDLVWRREDPARTA